MTNDMQASSLLSFDILGIFLYRVIFIHLEMGIAAAIPISS